MLEAGKAAAWECAAEAVAAAVASAVPVLSADATEAWVDSLACKAADKKVSAVAH